MNTSSLPTLYAQRLQFCIIIVAILHILLIFGISWQSQHKMVPSLLAPVLEITLATQASEVPPEEAKFAAAEHQQPSSPQDTEMPVQTVQNADFPDQQIHDLWQPSQPQAQIAQPLPLHETVTSTEANTFIPNQPLPVDESNAELMSTEQQAISQRIASLMAELADQQQQYAQMPRKRAITAAAQATADAEYLYDWRRHIERIGNLNYPVAARQLGLSGEVLLLVAINADGSLQDVQIRQSSGSKILDEAAMRIVKLAAPFEPLPAEIRATTDVLEIIRTWQFSAEQEMTIGQ